MSSLPDGKLPGKLLQELLSKLAIDDVSVAIGPGLGEDAAAIDRGDHYLLLAADPITFLPQRIGWYAVHVNANDIAAMGGRPQYFLSTILLPSGDATEEMAKTIVSDIATACRELGCLAVGGHTEVTPGIDRPLVAGAMVGEVSKDKLVSSSGARPGDMLLITKGIAVEATAILAQERRQEIEDAFGEAFATKAAAFLDEPGLSVVRDAHAAVEAGRVNAMHDVTEGGIATALWELADASGAGIVVSESEIPRFWESAQLAELFHFNLLGAIGSGALLMTVPESDTGAVLSSLESQDIDAYVIGRIVDQFEGVRALRGEDEVELPRYVTDEISRVLSAELDEPNDSGEGESDEA